MVEVGSAVACEHTAGVHLEAHLVGLDGNADWAGVGHGIEEVGLVADVLVTGHTTLRNGGGVAGLARAITASVRIGILSGDSGLLVEGESVVHQTTVATRILLGAVNQLLLTEGLQIAGGDFPLALKTASGGEGPAGSALALVLDWGHCTLGGPVDARRSSLAGMLVGSHLGHVAMGWLLEAEHGLLVLLVGHGSERAGVAESDTVLAAVGLDVIDVCLESGWDVAVALAMHSLELGPLTLVRCRSRERAAHGWVRWRAISDTALVHATLDQDVAVHTPRCTPGVLHLPVVSATLRAKADGEHTVVEVGSAVACEHTAGVHLEAHLVGLDGNADWASVGHGIEEVGLVADVLVTGHTTLRNGLSVAGLASAVPASVSIRTLR